MVGTIKILKAICIKDDRFLCVQSPESGFMHFPTVTVTSFRNVQAQLENLLQGIYDDELLIGNKICDCYRTVQKQKHQFASYLCYATHKIDHLTDGTPAIWLSQEEMANHHWEDSDQKTADNVISPLFRKSPYTTKTAIQRHANEAIGLTLGEIDSENTKNQDNKSYPGNVIEQIWFGHPADNTSAPDFPEAEVELKVTPIDIKTVKDTIFYQAGERLVLNTINYRKESIASFETSSFWKKNKFIELVQYIRRDISQKGKIEDKRQYKIAFANLLAMDTFSEPDFPQGKIIQLDKKHIFKIKQDWNKIHTLITEGRADELTESMTHTVAACTKGRNNKQHTKQANGTDAKTRAYCFRQDFMTTILETYLGKQNKIPSLIKDANQLLTKDSDDIILEYFEPYRNLTFTSIAKHFHLSLPQKSPKNINYMLVRHMLGLSEDTQEKEDDTESMSLNAEELKGIRIKTFPLFHGKPIQDFKIQPIPDFKKMVKETWNMCPLHNLLECQKFLILIFDNRNQSGRDWNPENIYFRGATFWSMPASDIDIARQVWQEDIEKLKNGIILEYKRNRVYNNFVKASARRVIHMRPDASKAQYCAPSTDAGNNSRELPTEAHWINRPSNHQRFSRNYITKQAWWINKLYLYDQIKGTF